MYTRSHRDKVRQPHVAGQFYPDDPVELTKTIAGYFSQVEDLDVTGEPVALICPHAGYQYSGKVAAHAYKLLKSTSFNTVVVISPSHTMFFNGAAVYDGGMYRTPLGDIPVDIDFVGKLTSINPRISLSDSGHNGRGGRHEHALEVQLPFLQIALGSFMLVPVVMGDQEYETCRALGEALGEFAVPGKTLIVASSDLSHFHSYDEAKQLDQRAADAIAAFSPSKLMKTLESGETEACGGGPIAAAMIAAQKMGGSKAHILQMANSGDVEPGFSDQVVGYLSAVITSEATKQSPSAYELREKASPDENIAYSQEEQQFLKRIARKSIEQVIKGSRVPDLAPPTGRLSHKRGVFVTLKKDDIVRGRVGYIQGIRPLVEAVRDMARAAATEDDRWAPISPDEIEDLDIEVTVLSPMTRVEDILDILVGRDGLFIKIGFQSGMLFPETAVANDWNRETFLAQTCLEGHLPADAWQAPEAEIYRFTVTTF